MDLGGRVRRSGLGHFPQSQMTYEVPVTAKPECNAGSLWQRVLIADSDPRATHLISTGDKADVIGRGETLSISSPPEGQMIAQQKHSSSL